MLRVGEDRRRKTSRSGNSSKTSSVKTLQVSGRTELASGVWRLLLPFVRAFLDSFETELLA